MLVKTVMFSVRLMGFKKNTVLIEYLVPLAESGILGMSIGLAVTVAPVRNSIHRLYFEAMDSIAAQMSDTFPYNGTKHAQLLFGLLWWWYSYC